MPHNIVSSVLKYVLGFVRYWNTQAFMIYHKMFKNNRKLYQVYANKSLQKK